MVVLGGISCDGSIRRSQLKHTWLENQVTNKTPEDVVLFWQGPGWPAFEREFRARVNEAQQLADDLETAFSPAQLVEQVAPLSALTADMKRAISKAVHAVYLERSGIAASKQPMKEAVAGVSKALNRFRAAWCEPVSEDAEREVRASWYELYQYAEQLLGELDRLPRGVVLP